MFLVSSRCTVRLHCWMVGVRRSGSTPAGEYTEQPVGTFGPPWQVGGSVIPLWSGYKLNSPFPPVNVNCSRAFVGGLGCSRIPRLSIRSLWIPKPARTAHVPVPVGSQARPTRGCNNSLAWFVSKHEFPTTVSVEITKFLSHL